MLDTELSSVHLKVVIEKYLRMIERGGLFFSTKPSRTIMGGYKCCIWVMDE